jgi:hypothetical protein
MLFIYLGGEIMATLTKRATVYFDTNLHKALRLKSVETSRSVSELVNDAVKEALAEDAEDLKAFEQRAREPLMSYEEMVKRLKKDGRI